MKTPIRVLTLLFALTTLAWAVHAAVTPISGDSRPAPPIDDSRRGQIADLDAKIKQLRQDFHAALDPLLAQVKTIRDQY